jgi:osmotically-inducible protein OsmY
VLPVTFPETDPTVDEQLRARILLALARDGRTLALDIRLGVLSGFAHLAGQVPSLDLRSLTESIVSGVPGVRGVANRIEAPGAPSPARSVNLTPSDEGSTRRDE